MVNHDSVQEIGKEGLVEDRHNNKLYIGNLDHRVTEYHVIKMLSPFGKICCEEYIWHTHGPKRGEPRGFAFVEFSKREEAEKAKESMNGKLAFGRPLVVRFVDEKIIMSTANSPSYAAEVQTASVAANPLSPPGFPTSRSAKIAAIQNKLKAMEEEDRKGNSAGPSKVARISS